MSFFFFLFFFLKGKVHCSATRLGQRFLQSSTAAAVVSEILRVLCGTVIPRVLIRI